MHNNEFGSFFKEGIAIGEIDIIGPTFVIALIFRQQEQGPNRWVTKIRNRKAYD